jgi:hypothetical protein
MTIRSVLALYQQAVEMRHLAIQDIAIALHGDPKRLFGRRED